MFYFNDFTILFQILRLNLQKMFYAVAKGRKIGIFNTWPECQAQITGFAGPKFKKFETRDEAQAFISQHSSIRVEESDVKPSRRVQIFQLLKKTKSD